MLIQLTVKQGNIFVKQPVDILKYRRIYRIEGEKITCCLEPKKMQWIHCLESPDQIWEAMNNGR